jgi:hypothetical protein
MRKIKSGEKVTETLPEITKIAQKIYRRNSYEIIQ